MVTAVLSFVYFGVFWIFYRDPSEDTGLSDVERAYIQEGGANKEGVVSASTGAMLGYVLRSRKVWGLTIGFGAYGYSMNLFTSWLPAYLVQTMHVNIIRSAAFTMIPWSCATIVGPRSSAAGRSTSSSSAATTRRSCARPSSFVEC